MFQNLDFQVELSAIEEAIHGSHNTTCKISDIHVSGLKALENCDRQ